MKPNIKNSWAFKTATTTLIMAMLLSLTAFIWRWQLLPPQIPLWYSRPWGEEQLANPLWLLLLPATNIVVYVLNSILAYRLTPDHLTFTKVLFTVSALVNLLNTVTLINIISLIT